MVTGRPTFAALGSTLQHVLTAKLASQTTKAQTLLSCQLVSSGVIFNGAFVIRRGIGVRTKDAGLVV